MYTVTRDHITSLSPFAVIGAGANTTSVNKIVTGNTINVYPNPATNSINVTGNYTHAKIYNLTGTMVRSVNFNKSIAISELPNVYIPYYLTAQTQLLLHVL